MTKYRIVFYEPRSASASFVGVILRMSLIVLPLVIVFLAVPRETKPLWPWMLGGLVLGFLLGMRSEFLIYPLVGRRTEYVFEGSRLLILHEGKSRELALSRANCDTLEVPADGGAVRHIVVQPAEGAKIDIFETWVTGETAKDFDTLFLQLQKDAYAW